MFRRIVAIGALAVGFVIALPATSQAFSALNPCTDSGTVITEEYEFSNDPFDPPMMVGMSRNQFMGTGGLPLLGVWRVWHVNIKANGQTSYLYDRAFAVKCNAQGQVTQTLDLTRTGSQMTPATDKKCDTVNFTAGGYSYGYMGQAREGIPQFIYAAPFGDKFHYWRYTYTSGTFIAGGVTVARCA